MTCLLWRSRKVPSRNGRGPPRRIPAASGVQRSTDGTSFIPQRVAASVSWLMTACSRTGSSSRNTPIWLPRRWSSPVVIQRLGCWSENSQPILPCDCSFSSSAEQSGGNGAIIRDRLGAGYRLLKMARWEEGLAVAPGSGITTIQGAVELRSSKQQWVGREVGSGARQCLDELLDGRPAPKKIARDHAGVAEAIRCGWADVGVCLKLSAEEAGLEFLSVRHETYDICYRAEFEPDPRFQALLTASRSPTFRKLLGELPGYEVAHTGELESI